jgi:serine/threonine-protein kinase
MRLADRYVVTDRIGAGGMSEVWRATDEVLGRRVAVKVLASPLAADPVLRATTRREARATAGLAHPHVTQVYDYGETAPADGTPVPYLVMELIQGQDLDIRLQAGPLPWQQAVQIGADTADALSAAHRVGLVHRDIKPGNVMLTPRGAKVLDFGIATLTGGDAAGGWLVGTPTYAAPEQAHGGPADPATDVYSLGVLLYECLTGHPPRRIANWADMAAVHATPAAPPHVSGLPADVAAIVERCLHPDPTRRPSAADVADTLGAAVGLPARTDQPTVAIPAYKGARVARPTMVEPLPSDLAAARTGRGWHRPGVVAVIGAVAAIGLVVLLVAAGLPDRTTSITAAAPTSTPTPATTRPPDTPAAEVPAAGPTDAAGVPAALRAGVDAGVAAGDIDATAARQLQNTISDLGKRSGHGKQGQLAKRGTDIVNTINELARQGHIAPRRADQLRALLQPITAQRDEQ